MSIWHWLVILIILGIPLAVLWLIIYTAVRAASRRKK